MERAIALHQGRRIEVGDLPEEVRLAVAVPILSGAPRPLRDIEKEYILAVLARNGNNQVRTAKDLAIGTATLYRKLKQYGGAAKAAPGTDAE